MDKSIKHPLVRQKLLLKHWGVNELSIHKINISVGEMPRGLVFVDKAVVYPQKYPQEISAGEDFLSGSLLSQLTEGCW